MDEPYRATRNGTALRPVLTLGLLAASLAVAALGGPRKAAPIGAAPGSIPPDLEAACEGATPYFVTTCFDPPGPNQFSDWRRPAIVAFRNTSIDRPHFALAEHEDVGAVWGLAYSQVEHALYASAFLKRQIAFGPGGPGAIYRIDLRSGAIRHFATVPNAGEDPHEPNITVSDRRARPWVTKRSLGDIDLNVDGSELYAMNLNDRRIYRLALPSGQILGSFPHGAAAESWAEDARPFGLSYHEGRVYHGLVNSVQSGGQGESLAAYVYSSRPDGAEMRFELRVALTYTRGSLRPPVFPFNVSLRWRPWTDLDRTIVDYIVSLYPMPILSDLAIDGSDRMILGLRDRHGDAAQLVPRQPGNPDSDERFGFGIGDILLGQRSGGAWNVAPFPEHFDDQLWGTDESGQGGLALWGKAGQVISSVAARDQGGRPGGFHSGALWFETDSGNRVALERVCHGFGPRPAFDGRGRALGLDDDVFLPVGVSLGDTELLCGPTLTPTPTSSPTPRPSATPTHTPSRTPSPTRTATPTRTPSPSATPTATPLPTPVYLPVLLSDPPCDPSRPGIDVVLVLDASTSMLDPTRAGRAKIEAAREAAARFLDQLALDPAAPGGDRAAIVGFNARAWLAAPLGTERAGLATALQGLAVAQLTRIDLGLAVAREELAGPRARPGSFRTVILLTDGRNNPEPVESAIAQAEALKAAGARLFTVGLGEDVDHAALARMASTPADYYPAPDGEDLAEIYRRIAERFHPCPPERFWPNRASTRPGAVIATDRRLR